VSVAVEGVIKFDLAHARRPVAARHAGLAALLAGWRSVLRDLAMVGEDPARYGGAGFGNLSARIGRATTPGRRAMLVTGSQTGGRARLGLAGFAVVSAYDLAAGRVTSHGLVRPSSEAMTHGAIYDLDPAIRFVFHVHEPRIWRHARALGIATTPREVAYGTAAMARAVAALDRRGGLRRARVVAMAGHEDGVIGFGATAEEAGGVLVGLLARARGMR
jgi:ribulose-5-phosphate 4-epimerase/fuculose-1-phosphate aldolase